MKKFFAFSSLIILLFAASSFADDEVDEQYSPRQKNLGKDRTGIQWWIVDFGTSASGYYAIAREYYNTNAAAKSELVYALTTRYGVSQSRAEDVYFAEFRFEYTSDGRQYTEVSRVLYDMRGEEICSYRASYTSSFIPVIPNTVQSKGVAYAMGLIR